MDLSGATCSPPAGSHGHQFSSRTGKLRHKETRFDPLLVGRTRWGTHKLGAPAGAPKMCMMSRVSPPPRCPPGSLFGLLTALRSPPCSHRGVKRAKRAFCFDRSKKIDLIGDNYGVPAVPGAFGMAEQPEEIGTQPHTLPPRADLDPFPTNPLPSSYFSVTPATNPNRKPPRRLTQNLLNKGAPADCK